MIDVVNCTQHYGIRPILRDINLHINKGELVALMGPNGMGKTTLLAAMAGVLSPTRGHIEIDGKRRRRTEDEESAIRSQVVYLPTDLWIPARQSGLEWLVAVGKLYRKDEEELLDHAQRLLDLFDLTKMADASFSSYSSGQRKKIALSAALISQAPVMLLDEPFAGGLDPGGILALKRVLQHLRDTRQTTIVITTPVPELVEELADRIAFLHEGRIVAFDTVPGLARLAGRDGNLDAIYQQLVSPENSAKIDRYFENAKL
jgi:ABC-2 type transport system ATP-binding protein